MHVEFVPNTGTYSSYENKFSFSQRINIIHKFSFLIKQKAKLNDDDNNGHGQHCFCHSHDDTHAITTTRATLFRFHFHLLVFTFVPTYLDFLIFSHEMQ